MTETKIKGFQIDASIIDLNDVTVGSPPLIAGDVLIYTGTVFTNTPTPILLGLDGLPDVTLTPEGSPGEGLVHDEKEILSYDKGIEQWIDRKIPEAGLLAASTGTFDGGLLQLGTPSGSPAIVTTVTVTAGSGIVVDNYTDTESPTYTLLTWGAFTDVVVTNLATTAHTYFAINSSGILLQQTTEYSPAQHRDVVHIGTAGHPNFTNVAAVRSNPHSAFDAPVRLSDLAEAIGAFNISGNVYSASPGSPAMGIDKSAGTSYRLGANFHTDKASPDITTDAFQGDLTWNYSYRGASDSEFIYTAPTTVVDAENYDGAAGSPTGLESMPVNDWQVQILRFFPGPGQHRFEYGQTTYGTAAAAIAAIPDINHNYNPEFADGVVRGYLVVQQGTTDLVAHAAQFVEAGKFGASGAGGSSSSGIFSSAFESSALTITASSDHSAAHGLGIRPSGMQAFLRCNTAEFGYSIGDEAEFMNAGTTNYKGLYADATNIGWYTGPALSFTDRTTGVEVDITLASWDIVLRAYA